MSGTECLRQLNRLRDLANLAEGEGATPEALAARLFGKGSVRDDFVSLPTEAELVRVGSSFRIFVRAKLPPAARAQAVAYCIAEWCLRQEAPSVEREERANTALALASAIVAGVRTPCAEETSSAA
jgi:hypothetical protein